jgi:hypothetical protein
VKILAGADSGSGGERGEVREAGGVQEIVRFMRAEYLFLWHHHGARA